MKLRLVVFFPLLLLFSTAFSQDAVLIKTCSTPFDSLTGGTIWHSVV